MSALSSTTNGETFWSHTSWKRKKNFKLLLSVCEIHFYYYQKSLNRFPFLYFFISFTIFWLLNRRWNKGWNRFSFLHYYLFSKWNSFVISLYCIGIRRFMLLVFKWDFSLILAQFYLRFFIVMRCYDSSLNSSSTFHSVSSWIRIFCHMTRDVGSQDCQFYISNYAVTLWKAVETFSRERHSTIKMFRLQRNSLRKRNFH